jgi:hypothetical protein
MHAGQSAGVLEDVARLTLDLHAGCRLSEDEWSETRAKLLEFMTILREWDQRAKNPKPRRGNVEDLCQRET